jgi:hypothetical protein
MTSGDGSRTGRLTCGSTTVDGNNFEGDNMQIE